MPEQNIQPPNHDNFWVESLKAVGLSLFLAFGIRTAVAQSYFIPSSSMEPTLKIDDRLMVDKLSYHFANPQRGDIVVFNPPEAVIKEQNLHDPFIKRVIGLPGEQVEVKGGRVYINNLPLRENYIADKPNYAWGPQIVPPNSYLVLGDNRNNSYDGHYWGFVRRDHIIGRAVVRFWPLDRISGLGEQATRLDSTRQ